MAKGSGRKLAEEVRKEQERYEAAKKAQAEKQQGGGGSG
jgi:hypothetical protein